jgi:hypothetical protein
VGTDALPRLGEVVRLEPFPDALLEGAIEVPLSAYESADLDALVALLSDDVFISMPPMPFEYEGRDVVAGFCASIFAAGRRFDLLPCRCVARTRGPAGLRAMGTAPRRENLA